MHRNSALHPATRIAIWLTLTVAVQWAGGFELAALSVVLGVWLIRVPGNNFLRMLRRTRWLMLSLAIIYGFATPGVTLLPVFGAASPTSEGLVSGAIQAWRLTAILGALALLMAYSTRDQLLSGLYVLLGPCKWLGIAPERMAVRLWLTLHYTETAAAPAPGDWKQPLQRALLPGEITITSVVLDDYPFTWRDPLALAAGVALAGILVA